MENQNNNGEEGKAYKQESVRQSDVTKNSTDVKNKKNDQDVLAISVVINQAFEEGYKQAQNDADGKTNASQNNIKIKHEASVSPNVSHIKKNPNMMQTFNNVKFVSIDKNQP